MASPAERVEAARRNLRTALGRLVVLLGILFCLLVLNPIAMRWIRLGEVGIGLLLWAGVLALLWPKPAWRWGLLLFTGGIVAFACWPATLSVPAAELRPAYLQALRRYEGVRYVWGGESPTGIDCSGLMRRGLMDALLSRALTHGDPAALRASLRLWWSDQSARDLGAGAGGTTVPVTTTPSLNALDAASIQPGDLAVTRSGVHVLAHLGGGEWLQADAHPMRVVRVQAPSDGPWFDEPMNIVRWRMLAQP